ncbi:hypothetical protein D3C85_1750320 [compost metagenome]
MATVQDTSSTPAGGKLSHQPIVFMCAWISSRFFDWSCLSSTVSCIVSLMFRPQAALAVGTAQAS